MKKAIINGTIYTPTDKVENGLIIISNNKIESIGSNKETPIPIGAEIIDAQGSSIVPGFIDVHLHAKNGACRTV